MFFILCQNTNNSNFSIVVYNTWFNSRVYVENDFGNQGDIINGRVLYHWYAIFR